jgi:hypothetical protein
VKGRFVIYVRRGPDDVGERNFDARHKTLEAARREIEHSSPAPPGCEYFIVEEPDPSRDPLGLKKRPKGIGRT